MFTLAGSAAQGSEAHSEIRLEPIQLYRRLRTNTYYALTKKKRSLAPDHKCNAGSKRDVELFAAETVPVCCGWAGQDWYVIGCAINTVYYRRDIQEISGVVKSSRWTEARLCRCSTFVENEPFSRSRPLLRSENRRSGSSSPLVCITTSEVRLFVLHIFEGDVCFFRSKRLRMRWRLKV